MSDKQVMGMPNAKRDGESKAIVFDNSDKYINKKNNRSLELRVKKLESELKLVKHLLKQVIRGDK